MQQALTRRPGRGLTLRLRLATVLAALLIASACASAANNDGSTSPSPDETAAAEAAAPVETADASGEEQPARWASCEHPDGIVVSYPPEWSVNDAGMLQACSAFDPEPIDDADTAGEFVEAAVLLSVQQIEFGAAADPGALAGDVIDRSESMVDGHDAVRIETEGSEDGERTTRWLIVGGRSRTVSLVTHEAGNSDAYGSNRDVLDEMVSRLQLPADV